MNHTGSPKKVIFSAHEVEITEISSGKVIAKGVTNHTSKVYMFSHFLPYSNPSPLLIHANEESKLWHEIFGHINYKYLSDLSEKDMVIGLPKIKFSKGSCQGCILGKANHVMLSKMLLCLCHKETNLMLGDSMKMGNTFWPNLAMKT